MYKAKSAVFSYSSFLIVAVVILFATYSFAQDKNESKLDKVKGNIQKITIQTDIGTTTFEGKDAKDLFKKLKSSDMHRMRIFKSGGENDEDVFIISPDKMNKDFSFFGNEMKDGKKIEIKIDKKDGEKTLTVTTTGKDGKSTTETYTGKDADEYLAKHGHKKFDMKWLDKKGKEGDVFFFRKGGDDSTRIDDHIKRWVSKDSTNKFYIIGDDDYNGIKKMIKVTDENGVKKVTVTTTDENGKEKTETYVGKDAEKYLEKNDVKVKVKIDGNKDGEVKEIIIRKKERKEGEK